MVNCVCMSGVRNGRNPTIGKLRGPGGNGGSPFDEIESLNLYHKIAKNNTKIVTTNVVLLLLITSHHPVTVLFSCAIFS